MEFLLQYVCDCEESIFPLLISDCTKLEKKQRLPNVEGFLKKFEIVCRQHTKSEQKNDKMIKKKPFSSDSYASTEDLLNSLNSVYDLTEFIHRNEKNFEKMDVAYFFDKVLSAKSIKKSDVIKNSAIERTYGYQILNGTKKPSRDKLIQLCIGAEFSFEETQTALKRTGFAPLYTKCKRDCIIVYAIKSKKSVIDTDFLLNKFDEKILNLE